MFLLTLEYGEKVCLQITDTFLCCSNSKKILEKLYSDRLDSFLHKYNILRPSQHGFRSKMSTSHALIELVEEITASLDNNKYAIGIFVGLKKAFDTVNHNIFPKLYFYGIHGVAHNGL